jgi:hypothetical protein
MNEIDDLLQRIEVPPYDAADDVARGQRALRRRHRWEVGGAALCVMALAGAGVAISNLDHSSDNAGFTDQPGQRATTHQPSRDPHATTHQPSRDPHATKHENQPEPEPGMQVLDIPSMADLRPYRAVLDEHLDPRGDLLGPVFNVQGGSGAIGTKLDWNHGGMLELVIGPGWNAAAGYYQLSGARMRPTTYAGHPARVSSAGADTVVSVQHADGHVVTLIASTTLGNNGTSTSATNLTPQQLLKAAADPRLSQ